MALLHRQSVRTLLETLTHKPVDVVHRVGSVLLLCISVVEERLLARLASTVSGRTVGGAVACDGSLPITDEDRKRAVEVVVRAKRLMRLHVKKKDNRAQSKREESSSGDNRRDGVEIVSAVRLRGKSKATGNSSLSRGAASLSTTRLHRSLVLVTVEDLRAWAIVRKRNLPCLQQLLEAASDALQLSDVLLVRHFVELIRVEDAGKALREAGVVLAHVTRTCDAVIEEATSTAANTVQRFWLGKARRRQWRAERTKLEEEGEERTMVGDGKDMGEDVDNSREKMTTVNNAIVRVQAAARRALARQRFHAARNARAERLTAAVIRVQAVARGWHARRNVRALRALIVVVDVTKAAARAIQAFWRGIVGRDIALRRKLGVILIHRWYRLSTVQFHLLNISKVAKARGEVTLAASAALVGRRVKNVFSCRLAMDAPARRRLGTAWLQKEWATQVSKASLKLHDDNELAPTKAAEAILRSLVTRRFARPLVLGCGRFSAKRWKTPAGLGRNADETVADASAFDGERIASPCPVETPPVGDSGATPKETVDDGRDIDVASAKADGKDGDLFEELPSSRPTRSPLGQPNAASHLPGPPTPPSPEGQQRRQRVKGSRRSPTPPGRRLGRSLSPRPRSPSRLRLVQHAAGETRSPPPPPECDIATSTAEDWDSLALLEHTAKRHAAEPGLVFTFGSGDVGQLGFGVEEDSDMDVATPRLLERLCEQKVVSVACGGMSSAALTVDGRVFTWGCSDDGGLGRPITDEAPEEFPAEVREGLEGKEIVGLASGDCHTLAWDRFGNVFGWGCYRDKHGTMWFQPPPGKGAESCKGVADRPVLIAGLPSSVVDVKCGASSCLTLTTKGDVFSWGIGELGELGRDVCHMNLPASPDSDDPPEYNFQGVLKDHLTPGSMYLDTGADRADGLQMEKARAIGCGSYHSIVVNQHGHVFTCGLNNHGQLGLGDIEDRKHLTLVKSLAGYSAVETAGGGHHSLVQTTKGLFSFGRNDSGQLGWKDEEPGKIGKHEPYPKRVLLPSDAGSALKVACSGDQSILITEKHELYTWGYGDSGALGQGDSGAPDGNGPESCPIPKIVDTKALGITKVIDADAGGQHTVILGTVG